MDNTSFLTIDPLLIHKQLLGLYESIQNQSFPVKKISLIGIHLLITGTNALTAVTFGVKGAVKLTNSLVLTTPLKILGFKCEFLPTVKDSITDLGIAAIHAFGTLLSTVSTGVEILGFYKIIELNITLQTSIQILVNSILEAEKQDDSLNKSGREKELPPVPDSKNENPLKPDQPSTPPTTPVKPLTTPRTPLTKEEKEKQDLEELKRQQAARAEKVKREQEEAEKRRAELEEKKQKRVKEDAEDNKKIQELKKKRDEEEAERLRRENEIRKKRLSNG